MTIATLLQQTKTPSRTEASLLLCHVLTQKKEFLITHSDDTVSFWQQRAYKRLVKQRTNGTPLAYLVGHKEFYGLDFLVNKHTLVPRPETELLVELALQEQARHADAQTVCIDVGTGSGCIPIAMQANMTVHADVPTVCYATDTSYAALKVAYKNAAKHTARVTFFYGNLLEPVLHRLQGLNDHTHIIITANLPYLTEEQFQNEPSIQKEPKSALVAQDTGLALYKELLTQVQPLVAHVSLPISVFMEIDPGQAERLSGYVKKIFPMGQTHLYKDLTGKNRVLKVQFSCV
ncbi:MAG: peptide chain release factor N(5)-glutamine methyltransferase [Candidatus Magasanikbacteria bacterium CG10_big_fil_rev_8_21_14_0_10_43_6]|uniref:Peptide chain release factor N(5)-glutamine methyltransferase n=1 Tax=Candidatus Magasanikbacteria bacterium CG10_big_fil_rev_8_21_14_0_10_43_6 TaxID=1974650 RepID=A0A2M6W0S5_9BACT|nr:MAG: peptide chain release factor N(5)-glutamine methyltransferase [Candidatus Magasanikbacteria bacterium CG10_big_fil_rev_8_21_14_0_10_43_6]